VADLLPTVDFHPPKLDQAIEGYLCGLAEGAPDRDQLIEAHPNLADQLRDFLRDDEWMRRLAGSRPVDSSGGRRPAGWRRDDARSPGTTADAPVSGRFGEYDLLAEIGRGGMGVVYRARQRSLNRIVALKMIRSAQLASEQEVQRFYTEAESAAHLDHPGIVPVYAAGEHEGRHYYSMAFVEGISLQQLLADQTVLPAREAAELIRRVAEAIQYAHRRGVIHRDLKPANIMLAASDRADSMRLPGQPGQRFEPKVTDFGLAKKTDADSELTGTGQVLGSPSYMPPEQVAGEFGPLSDVYALGAVLYCLLTGRPPFRAANPVQTLQQVVHDEPVPPRRVNSAVPHDLETICLKCLQKSPGRRYVSAEELAADLKRFLDGVPIKARPVSAWERSYKAIRRHPATAALVVVGLTALMSCVGWLVSWRYQGQQDRQLAIRRVLAAHEAWRDNEITTAQELLGDCKQHLRGWEWYYVERLCRVGHVRTIRPPNSSDGPHAPARAAHPLLVCDPNSGHIVAVLDQTSAEPSAPELAGVRLGPGGRELETVSLPFQRLGDRFSPFGQPLEADNADRTVRLWDVEKRLVTRETKGHFGLLRRIAYSDEGGRVVAQLSSAFNGIRFPNSELLAKDLAPAGSDGASQEMRNALELAQAVLMSHSGSVNTVALSPGGQQLASAGNDGVIKLWDVTQRRWILDCEGHAGPVYDLSFSPQDGKRLASVGNDRTVRIWDALTGRLILTLDRPHGHQRAGNGIAWHPNAGQVASAGADLALKLWNVGSGAEAVFLAGHTGPARSVAFHPGGALLASAGDDGAILFWNPHTTALVGKIQAHDGCISALAFSPNGQLLASASHDRTVKVWPAVPELGEAAGVKPMIVVKGKGIVHGVAFSQDSRLLAAASHDGKRLIWNAATGQIHDEFERHSAPVFSTAFDPAGRFAATGCYDVTVRNMTRGSETLLKGHQREVLSVAFSPDGNRLASGSGDHVVRVWHATRGTRLATLNGHLAPVTSVVFSPKGDRVVSASWDGSIKVWDPDSGEETLSLKGKRGRVYCVAFSPDGQRLASANHDGTITIWGR
jgi:WD40 repeat protein/serine/threonine protein kinase